MNIYFFKQYIGGPQIYNFFLDIKYNSQATFLIIDEFRIKN
jgi:hypothetical protein